MTTDLITLLEGAEEGSRELDWAIRDEMMEYGWPANHPPLYSLSVDDALTLIPTWEPYSVGSHWYLMTPGRQNGAMMGDFGAVIHHPLSSGGGPKFEGFAKTLPLAICIAALRSRTTP